MRPHSQNKNIKGMASFLLSAISEAVGLVAFTHTQMTYACYYSEGCNQKQNEVQNTYMSYCM